VSGYLEINGARLAYDDTGDASKTAIVTLHGAPGMGSRANDWTVWTNLQDRYRIISYDQRGSGASSDTPPFTHEQFCADLEAIRQHLNLGKIILTGGSYGGMIAQEYVLRHQENVHALVLRDTSASNRFRGDSAGRALASGYPMDEEGLTRLFSGHTTSNDDFRELIRMIMPLYTVTPDPEGDAAKVAAMPLHFATHNFAFSQNQPSYDISARLGEIQIPVLVTVGRHDWITPLEASEEIAGGIPNAELVVFENSGHGPQNEERDLWLQTVREFLARVVPATRENGSA
jgi:proline iminopeptidase